MAYHPSLSDLPEDVGYQPSLSDIDDKSSHPQVSPFEMRMRELGVPTSSNLPLKEHLSQTVQNVGRGGLDFAEGMKQLFLEGAEQRGLIPKGSAQNYKDKAEQERKFYVEQMAASKNPSAKGARFLGANLPFAIPAGEVAATAKLLPQVIKGALTGGAIGASQFVGENDSRLQNILEGLGIGAGLPAGTAAMKGIGKVGSNILDAFKNSVRNLSPLEERVTMAKEQYGLDKNSLKSAQEQAQLGGQSSNPNVLQSKSLDRQEELQNLYDEMAQRPPVSSKNIAQSEENLNKLQADAENSANLVDKNKKDISEHLNEGAAHDVRAAAQIDAIQTARRQQISKGYDELEKDWKQKQIPIDNSKEIKEKTSELWNLIKSNESRSPQTTALLKNLDRLKEEKSINASDYLRAYRSASQFAREARQKAYMPGMNAEERKQWMDRYNELDEKVDSMGKTLEDNVGGNEVGRLRELNESWRTQVVPLYRNTIYQNIRKKGQMPDNIIKSLRGTDPGNQLLKGIIQENPDILKNVVGQRYFIKPNEVHAPNENMQEYLDKMPELKEMISNHQKAQELSELTSNKAKEAIKSHQELIKNHENISSQQKRAVELQDTISKQDKLIAELRQKENKKNMSLEEKMRTQNALKNARKIKQNARKKLLIAISIGVGTGVYKLDQLLAPSPEGEQ